MVPFYVQKVVKVGFPVCIITDQERTAIYRVVVYGFFYVQHRHCKLCAVSVPAVLCIHLVLFFDILAPFAVLGKEQHFVKVRCGLHLYQTQFSLHTLCVFRASILSGQVLPNIYGLCVHQDSRKRVFGIHQCFQIRLRYTVIPCILLRIKYRHSLPSNIPDRIPDIGVCRGGLVVHVFELAAVKGDICF